MTFPVSGSMVVALVAGGTVLVGDTAGGTVLVGDTAGGTVLVGDTGGTAEPSAEECSPVLLVSSSACRDVEPSRPEFPDYRSSPRSLLLPELPA